MPLIATRVMTKLEARSSLAPVPKRKCRRWRWNSSGVGEAKELVGASELELKGVVGLVVGLVTSLLVVVKVSQGVPGSKLFWARVTVGENKLPGVCTAGGKAVSAAGGAVRGEAAETAGLSKLSWASGAGIASVRGAAGTSGLARVAAGLRGGVGAEGLAAAVEAIGVAGTGVAIGAGVGVGIGVGAEGVGMARLGAVVGLAATVGVPTKPSSVA